MANKPEIYIEIMNLERVLGVTPHGSRHVGGWTDKSDWDYFCEGTIKNLNWLKSNGYIVQFATGYFGGDDPDGTMYEGRAFIAHKHPTLPIQVLAMSLEYYPVYFTANEQVKSMQGASILNTREGRVTTYKHFIAIERAKPSKTAEEIMNA